MRSHSFRPFLTVVTAIAIVSASAPAVARAADPAVAAGASLSLPSLLRDVAEANPALASSRAMATAAAARGRSAGAWESPMLEAGVQNFPVGGRFNEDEMTMKMIGVVQRVPLFGANGLRAKAAEEAAGAERSASDRAHLDVYGAAIEAYADAYYAQERLGEAARHEAVMRRFVDAATARYRAGNGRLDDVLRAEAEAARVRADAAGFRADFDRARALLEALRGGVALGEGATLSPPPALTIPPDAGPWVAAALEGHPRLREAEARERGYELSAEAARRMAWPDLEVRAAYGIRGRDAMGMELKDMVSATVGVMLPIFYGSREGAMSKEMTAMAEAAAADKRDAALDLEREARTLHADATAASRMATLLADTVVAVQSRAVEASWSAYSAGTADLWRVLEANHSLYGEDLALLDARRELARAQGRLVALTGRGDLAGVELPATRKDGK